MKHLFKPDTDTRKCFSSEHRYSKYISRYCSVKLEELKQLKELGYREEDCLIPYLCHYQAYVFAVFPSVQLFCQSTLFFRIVGVEGKVVQHPVQYELCPGTRRQNVLIRFSAFFCRQCCVCFLCSHCSCTEWLVIVNVTWRWAVMPVPSQRKVKKSVFVGDGARAAQPVSLQLAPVFFLSQACEWGGGRVEGELTVLLWGILVAAGTTSPLKQLCETFL